MTDGDKIKKIRTFPGKTQKELGVATGFDEKGAGNRIAQYETNYRVPKKELLDKIAAELFHFTTESAASVRLRWNRKRQAKNRPAERQIQQGGFLLTLCDSSLEYRADTNSINPVASGQVTIQRACIHGVSAVFGIIPTQVLGFDLGL